MAKPPGKKTPAAAPARQHAGMRSGRIGGRGGSITLSGAVAKPKAKHAHAAGAGATGAAIGTSAGGGSGGSGSGKPNRPPTAFEQRLYDVCKCIPAGRVTTYGAMAEVLGSAARACGQALRRNPFAPVVPCHRVIAASLELGGFSGSWGVGCANVAKKKRLLAEEGVAFDDSGRLLPSAQHCVMAADELRAAAAAAGVVGS